MNDDIETLQREVQALKQKVAALEEWKQNRDNTEMRMAQALSSMEQRFTEHQLRQHPKQ